MFSIGGDGATNGTSHSRVQRRRSRSWHQSLTHRIASQLLQAIVTGLDDVGLRAKARTPARAQDAPRSFGDIEYKILKEKSWGKEFTADLVSSEPELFTVERSKEDEFLIIACDGRFDTMSSQRAVSQLKSYLTSSKGDLQFSLDSVIKDAKYASKVADNMTILAVVFGEGNFFGK